VSITNLTDINLGCGLGSAKAKLVVDVNAGSNIAFNWSSGNNEHVDLVSV